MWRSGSYPVVFLCALFLSGCGKFGNPFAPDKKKNNDVGIVAKVRDFHEGNATSKDGTHPHFNQNQGSCEAQALGVKTVEEDIDVTETFDPDFPGDTRQPKLVQGLPAPIAKCFTPEDRFSDWFEDRSDD